MLYMLKITNIAAVLNSEVTYAEFEVMEICISNCCAQKLIICTSTSLTTGRFKYIYQGEFLYPCYKYVTRLL
jgi:hypothetical protein